MHPSHPQFYVQWQSFHFNTQSSADRIFCQVGILIWVFSLVFNLLDEIEHCHCEAINIQEETNIGGLWQPRITIYNGLCEKLLFQSSFFYECHAKTQSDKWRSVCVVYKSLILCIYIYKKKNICVCVYIKIFFFLLYSSVCILGNGPAFINF